MQAQLGDRVSVDGSGFSKAAGIYVGERDGKALVALREEDIVIVVPFAEVTIHRALVPTREDALRSEILDLKIARLHDALSVQETRFGQGLAQKLLLDLVPLVDLLPVPDAVRTVLHSALSDAVHALPE